MLNKVINVIIFLLLILYPTGVLFRFKLTTNILIVPQDVVVFCLFVGSLVFYIRKKTYPVLKGFLIAQICFVGIGLISLLINTFIHRDINILGASLYALRYIAYLSLIFIPNLFSKKLPINKLFLLSGTTVLILGFLQYFFFPSLKPLFYLGWDDHLYRLFTTFLDPNFAGVFLVVFLFHLLGDIFGRDKFKSYRNIVLSFFSIVAIYLTFSRTALVALISGAVFIFISKKKFKELAIVIAILISTFFVFSNTHIEGLNPFRTASTSERIKSSVSAFQIIEKNVFIGVGFNAFRDAQIRYGYKNIQGSSISNSDSGTDNSYLFVLATTGILGFIPYILSYFFLFRKIFREKQTRSFLLNGALVSVMAASVFLNSLFYTPLLGWLFLSISLREKQ